MPQKKHNSVRGLTSPFFLWGSFSALFALYLLFNREIILHPEIVLPRDSANYALEAFWYVGKFLQETGSLPLYIPSEGGVPLALVSNNYLLLSPWKIPGYLAVMTGADVNTAFKWSYFFGLFLCFGSIFLLYQELFRRSLFILLLLFITIFSGIGFGNYHQEQSLASLFWIPLILLLILKGAKENKPVYTVAAFALSGASLTLHYPHIPFLGIGVFLLSFLLTGQKKRVIPASFTKEDALSALLFFLLLSSPLWVAFFQYAGEYASPFRHTADISAGGFQEYRSIHFLSQPFHELFQFLGVHPPDHSEGMDNFPFFIGFLPLFFLPFLFRKKSFSNAAPYLLNTLFLFLLFMGISSFLPLLLFPLPGFSLFRQWYHFHPLFTLSLLILSGFAMQAYFHCRAEGEKRMLFFLQRGGLFFLLLLLLSFATGEFHPPTIALFLLWLFIFILLSAIRSFRLLLLSFILMIVLHNGQYAYLAVNLIGTSVAPALSSATALPLSKQDFSGRNLSYPLNDARLVAHKRIMHYQQSHPGEQVILSELRFFKAENGEPATPALHFKQKLPGRYTIETESKRKLIAVLTAPYSSHWKADIDGTPVPVLNLEDTFTGIQIPQGKHSVRLIYTDTFWVISLFLHFFTLFVLLPLYIHRKKRGLSFNSP